MKKLVCSGCNKAEDMNNPTGDIHPVQLVDVAPTYGDAGPPDKVIEEDLCKRCRDKIRQEFFGEEDDGLLDMPLMKGA